MTCLKPKICLRPYHSTQHYQLSRNNEIKQFLYLQRNSDEFGKCVKTRSAENYSDALSNTSLWDDNSPNTPIKTPLGTNKPTLAKSIEPTVPVHNIFCSTCNLNCLFDLLYSRRFDSFNSLDPASVGRCEDKSRVVDEYQWS